MNKFAVLFTSSIGRKIVMSLTGLFLCSFLIVHCGVNACLFVDDGGLTFNEAAHFMESNIIIRVVEYLLFAGFIVHILQAITLTLINKKARGSKTYTVQKLGETSTWYSRNMGILGTILFFFLVVHMINFFIGLRFDEVYKYGEDVNGHANLYANVKDAFSNQGVSIFYVLCMIALGFHLQHGFASGFQTLGVNHPYYTPMIKMIGYFFSILLPAVFAAMPIYFMLKF
jgi:succinate dehydrogenase / fumarate reductase, cytochrome b subunit